MKAIWLNKPYVIVDDSGEGVTVQAVWADAPPERQFVAYSDSTLVVDPTDAQWAEAVMAAGANSEPPVDRLPAGCDGWSPA